MKKIVLFDVDSTLVSLEGLDYIAERKGKGEEVKKLTELSMNGTVKMEEVFGKKIDLLSPTRNELEDLGNAYKESLVANAKEVIHALKQQGWKVGLVTGNFLPAIAPLAEHIGISPDLIFTNEIFFHPNGNYKEINKDHPLAKSGGKGEIVKKFHNDIVIFIGDSATDLDSKPYASIFVGFGGVVEREKVKKEAEYFIYELPELLDITKRLD